jgi:hypothetical protein
MSSWWRATARLRMDLKLLRNLDVVINIRLLGRRRSISGPAARCWQRTDVSGLSIQQAVGLQLGIAKHACLEATENLGFRKP